MRQFAFGIACIARVSIAIDDAAQAADCKIDYFKKPIEIHGTAATTTVPMTSASM